MLRNARRRRSEQRGQVLVLALVFIAFFGATIVAVLRVADLPGEQHAITEATAATDSGDEGGTAFGAADAARTNPWALTCAPGNSGQLTMQSGDKANYSVNTCNPSGSPSTGGGGQNCLLCLLNQVPIAPATSTTPSTVVFTNNRSMTTTGGDDYINGSMSGRLTAAPAGAQIFVLNGSDTSGCTCSPSAVQQFAPAIADPLSALPAPSPVAGQPAGCPSWNAATGCTENITGGTNTVQPGLWASLSISGLGTTSFAAGTYVFSGQLSVSGNGTIDATSGITLYLACANYGTTGAACPSTGVSGRIGGSINISGNGTFTFAPPSSGPYSGISVLSDPNLLDIGGTGSCVGGATDACVVDVSGNGATFSGTQDLRSGGAALHGDGGEVVTAGRFIANSLFINVNSHAGTGLSLTGPGTITTTTCGVFDDAVRLNSGPVGRAIIQSGCGTTKGVVDFNYSP